jgi:hypothetical protein
MTIESGRLGGLVLCATLLGAMPIGAQTLVERIEGAPDGKVRMTFAARPGVCGIGESFTTHRHDDEDWEWECDPSPVRVVLTKEVGDITRVRTFVGGRWREGSAALDLGTVPAREAADYFVTLAEHSHGRISRDAIRPATMADSALVWPALLRIARDDSRSRDTKRVAARWVGIAAGDVVMERSGAAQVEDPERETREQAVFALSRLPRDQAVPELLEVARTHRDPQVRKRALFWLGETGDERALDLFEEVLRR